MPVTPDVDADRLAGIAVKLAALIRDDDPVAVARWLGIELPNPADWFRLCFVLAAAVPEDQQWLDLTAWTVQHLHTR